MAARSVVSLLGAKVLRGTPLWSKKGPVGLRAWPTKTLYPVRGPLQQLVVETKR